MTTEITPTPAQIAEEFVKDNTASAIIEELTNHYHTIESQKIRLQQKDEAIEAGRRINRDVEMRITRFLKNHISEKEGATFDELKELANELDIELTKQITVKFNVVVEYEFEAPIDFDIDDISENDFDVTIRHSLENSDLSEESEQIDIEDFDTEEEK